MKYLLCLLALVTGLAQAQTVPPIPTGARPACWPDSGAVGLKWGITSDGGWAAWWCPGRPNPARAIMKSDYQVIPGATWLDVWYLNATIDCATTGDTVAQRLCSTAADAAETTKPAVVIPEARPLIAYGSFSIYSAVDGRIGRLLLGRKATAGALCNFAVPPIVVGTAYYYPLVGGPINEVTTCRVAP